MCVYIYKHYYYGGKTKKQKCTLYIYIIYLRYCYILNYLQRKSYTVMHAVNFILLRNYDY